MLHVSSQLQQQRGKTAVTLACHQPSAAVNGTSTRGTDTSRYGLNATTVEIVRDPRAKKKTSAKSLERLPFTVAIVLLYGQIILTFIPSPVSTSGDLFQVQHLYFLVAVKTINIAAHPTGSSYLPAPP